MTNLEIFMAALVAMACSVLLFGCGVGQYSATTTATYHITPDGKFIQYVSNKEQQGLELKLVEKDGQIQVVEIRVDKATTSESAIAAALQTNLKLIGMIEALIAKGAAGGK